MPKGRPTADYNVDADIHEGTLTIVITADVDDDVTFVDDDGGEGTAIVAMASGTVALGNLVADIGKVATPKTNAERKREANVALLVAAGLDPEVAAKAAANLK